MNCIVGWDSTIGKWARVEGTPSDPNPNDPYAKIDSETLFRDSKLTPSITILGNYNRKIVITTRLFQKKGQSVLSYEIRDPNLFII